MNNSFKYARFIPLMHFNYFYGKETYKVHADAKLTANFNMTLYERDLSRYSCKGTFLQFFKFVQIRFTTLHQGKGGKVNIGSDKGFIYFYLASFI